MTKDTLTQPLKLSILRFVLIFLTFILISIFVFSFNSTVSISAGDDLQYLSSDFNNTSLKIFDINSTNAPPSTPSLFGNSSFAKVDKLETWIKDKPIVFIGDSVTRYQYLSLAYRVLNGHYQIEEPDFTPDSPYNMNRENVKGSWNEYYNMTHTLLIEGEQTCDCFRSPGWPPVPGWRAIENRLFRYEGVTLAYYQLFIHNGTYSPAFKGRSNATHGVAPFEDEEDWHMTFAEMFDYIEKTYGDCYVVFNDGFWCNPKRIEAIEFISQYLKERNPKFKFIWRETTLKKDLSPNMDEEVYEAFRIGGALNRIGIVRTYQLMKDLVEQGQQLYIDHLHLTAKWNVFMNARLGETISNLALSERNDTILV